VFEQKYAGLSESELELAKANVEAAFKLAQKVAVHERFEAGDYEVIPNGESAGIPGDERIIAGRTLPGFNEHQVVRLDVDQYPEVYALFYEHLWWSTSR